MCGDMFLRMLTHGHILRQPKIGFMYVHVGIGIYVVICACACLRMATYNAFAGSSQGRKIYVCACIDVYASMYV